MSTLRCTNLQDTSGGNSLTTAQIYNGAAKAWVQFNGETGGTIQASFNVSSITNIGTGTFTVNFTTSMPDANYSVICSGDGKSMGAGVATPKSSYVLAGSVRTQWLDNATTQRNPEIASVAVFR